MTRTHVTYLDSTRARHLILHENPIAFQCSSTIVSQISCKATRQLLQL